MRRRRSRGVASLAPEPRTTPVAHPLLRGLRCASETPDVPIRCNAPACGDPPAGGYPGTPTPGRQHHSNARALLFTARRRVFGGGWARRARDARRAMAVLPLETSFVAAALGYLWVTPPWAALRGHVPPSITRAARAAPGWTPMPGSSDHLSTAIVRLAPPSNMSGHMMTDRFQCSPGRTPGGAALAKLSSPFRAPYIIFTTCGRSVFGAPRPARLAGLRHRHRRAGTALASSTPPLRRDTTRSGPDLRPIRDIAARRRDRPHLDHDPSPSWANAVPLANGRFDLDDPIDYVVEFPVSPAACGLLSALRLAATSLAPRGAGLRAGRPGPGAVNGSSIRSTLPTISPTPIRLSGAAGWAAS